MGGRPGGRDPLTDVAGNVPLARGFDTFPTAAVRARQWRAEQLRLDSVAMNTLTIVGLCPCGCSELFDLPLSEARRRLVRSFQREYVSRVMRATEGNVERAAERSGVTLRYFRALRSTQEKHEERSRG